MTTEIRLNKYLKDLGYGSRRKCEEYIKKGFVKLNGKIVTELATKVIPGKDEIVVSDEILAEKNKFVYILLNKPVGYVTTKSVEEGKTVFELLPDIEGLTYAGRLDKESEGLLVFSNDGEFIYRVASSENEKEKEYLVVCNKEITDGMLHKMRAGMQIDGKKTKPAKVFRVDEKSFRIILTEGINRQIRKMVRKVGAGVEMLKRIRIANIKNNIPEVGKWRYLTEEEKNIFLDKRCKNV